MDKSATPVLTALPTTQRNENFSRRAQTYMKVLTAALCNGTSSEDARYFHRCRPLIE